MIKKRHIFYILVVISLACEGCQPADIGQSGPAVDRKGLYTRVRNEIQPYALDLVVWEVNNLVFDGDRSSGSSSGVGNFSGLPENISNVLIAENITVFPPLRVKLMEPPLLLVISLRDRIVYFDRILLSPGLSAGVMAQIEEKVDALGLSSLVVQLGGFGAAYPAVVSPDMQASDIVNATVEEWAHQYLAFRPLGFLYLVDSLGLRQDPDIIVMNETLAGMIAQEIGGKVYKDYYGSDGYKSSAPGPEAPDFAKEMRETRLKVEGLLAAGKIDEAEGYMRDRRIQFNSQGYPIRKLNQAYFAFHGIYGQDPGAVSPVYRDMVELRKNCASLAGFVDRISGMPKYSELEKAVNDLKDKP